MKNGFSFRKKYICSKTDVPGHACIVGGSGSGKTSNFIIPSLRAWKSNFFAIDLNSDLLKTVNVKHKLVFDPYKKKSVVFDIFAPIRRKGLSTSEIHDELKRLSYLLMPDNPNMPENARYYQEMGRFILIASLIAFHKTLDFCDICKKIVTSDYNSLFGDIVATGNEAGDYLVRFKDIQEQ